MFKRHPKGILTIFLTEMWERFGFYIMSAVYVLYMDKVLHFDDSTKGNLYAIFLGAAYLFPILGGWLGDKILGQVRTIRVGAWMMLLGYVLLALSGKDAMMLFYIGLFMVAAGTGIFKVNMSVTVGNLYQDRIELKDAGFNIYYMSVNVGATVGPIAANIIGIMTDNYNLSFAAAAAGMLFAIGSLEIGKNLLSDADRFHTQSNPDKKRTEPAMDRSEFWQRVITLIVLFVIASFFWVPFYQNSFALTLFADRSTTVIEWLRPESYVTFNALFIILLTPPMLALFSRMRRSDKEPSTPVKIFMGLLIMGIAMFVMVWAGLAGGDSDLNIMSPMWLISTYFFITVAEIMISPMGQSYVSKVAPPQIQGLMMGGWFGATALGAMSSGIFGKFYSDMAHHQYFLLLGILSIFAAILVLIFMKKLKRFAG